MRGWLVVAKVTLHIEMQFFGLQKFIRLGILLYFISFHFVQASITAVSSIKACVNDGSGKILQKNGTACNKKLVVAMTVQGNEGKSQYLEADIRRVHDSTIKKNVQLKSPVRISVKKSPVLVNYRLYQIGYVNHNPREEVRKKKGSRCRSDWFSKSSQAACGFQYSKDKRIFDSQGFCCKCDMKNRRYDRGESVKCLRKKDYIAHCLRMDPLHDFVFGLYPPQLIFNITITIEKVSYSTVKGKTKYEKLDTIVIGPSKRIASSKDLGIRVEYIADFHPNDFMPVLAHKYLLVPDIRKLNSFSKKWTRKAKDSGLWDSIQNASEWLLVDKHNFGFSGLHCNKIGVSYSAFRNQGDGCTNIINSCLQGQPYQLWQKDVEKRKSGRKGQYMLYNFGRVHSLPHSKKTTNFQLNFIAQRAQRSLITLSMQADNLKAVVNKSPGRIVEAFIDPFESLSTDGLLNVYVQNIGSITATYNLFVGHCSAGVDWVPSETVTLDPGEESNVTFTMHSFHSVGQINTCEVELLDQSSELMDNMTVNFETMDTCFCYGYCGCSCGDNVTDCPPKPNYHDEDKLKGLHLKINFEEPQIKFLRDVTEWMKSHLGGILITTWIIFALIGLGVLKVVMMVYTGEVKFPALTKPSKAILKVTCTIFSTCYGKLCGCLFSATTNIAWGAAVIASGKNETKYVGREDLVSKNVKRPVNCDGMCRGAKKARRIHRKKLRLMKRRGARMNKMNAWWEKSYNCTCTVKDTQNVIEIFKGLCFFVYCPLLPLWWILEFFIEWIMRKRRRERRRKKFIKKKADKRSKDENTYLMLDKYTRGTTEKKMIDFNEEKKKTNSKKKGKINDSHDQSIDSNTLAVMEEGLLQSSSSKELGFDSMDTTDTDEAFDIDELIDPGYPVYFNYADIKSKTFPSLKCPGKNFSLKGRLTEKKTENTTEYIFNLYKYTTQFTKQVKGKVVSLKTSHEINPEEFQRALQPNIVQSLVTLAPLFTCLNDKKKTK